MLNEPKHRHPNKDVVMLSEAKHLSAAAAVPHLRSFASLRMTDK